MESWTDPPHRRERPARQRSPEGPARPVADPAAARRSRRHRSRRRRSRPRDPRPRVGDQHRGVPPRRRHREGRAWRGAARLRRERGGGLAARDGLRAPGRAAPPPQHRLCVRRRSARSVRRGCPAGAAQRLRRVQAGGRAPRPPGEPAARRGPVVGALRRRGIRRQGGNFVETMLRLAGGQASGSSRTGCRRPATPTGPRRRSARRRTRRAACITCSGRMLVVRLRAAHLRSAAARSSPRRRAPVQGARGTPPLRATPARRARGSPLRRGPSWSGLARRGISAADTRGADARRASLQ